jgi:hypothetical protein
MLKEVVVAEVASSTARSASTAAAVDIPSCECPLNSLGLGFAVNWVSTW